MLNKYTVSADVYFSLKSDIIVFSWWSYYWDLSRMEILMKIFIERMLDSSSLTVTWSSHASNSTEEDIKHITYHFMETERVPNFDCFTIGKLGGIYEREARINVC